MKGNEKTLQHETSESYIFKLYIKFGNIKFYVCDTDGTISKSQSDGMVFLDKETALRYQGQFENLFEEKFLIPSRMDIERILVSVFTSRVHKTFI